MFTFPFTFSSIILHQTEYSIEFINSPIKFYGGWKEKGAEKHLKVMLQK